MLAGLAAHYPQVGETYDIASQVLGYDLWALVQDGPEQELNLTHRTQPAMLAAGVAAGLYVFFDMLFYVDLPRGLLAP